MVPTDEDGNYTATSGPGQPGGNVTATATDESGNTSEPTTVFVETTTVPETVETIGSLLGARSQLILTHQPDYLRRIERLEGRASSNGSISGFGLSYRDENLPFDAQMSEDGGSFSYSCLLYTSPSPRDKRQSRMPSSA